MAGDPADITGWQRLDQRTTTSGRITADDIARLSAIGVRHVINLALADSQGGMAGEDQLIAAAGMRYTHIPVPFEAPEEGHYEAFRAAYSADEETVHVHCIANWRVSAFFYRLNRERGMPQSEARALMEQQWTPEATEYKPWAEFVARGAG